ncbi:MAG: hypothetical protein ABUL64_03105 [Singulisphaera sp.]
MRGLRWAIYLWPGLADLWWHGAWSGLALASSHAVLTGLVIAATLVWGELLGPDLGRSIWGAYAIGWLALLVVSMRTSPRAKEAQLAGASDLFPGALAEYLRGNWLEAELLARRQIASFPSDIETTVLLAATLRHVNRFDEAYETLDAAALWERAETWKLEIDSQYRRLTEKQSRLSLESLPPRRPAEEPAEQTEHEVQRSESPANTLPEWRNAA